ncbi:MAG: hypothetical protein DRI90_14860 [Deltaproteobacteria bacterium]|nr:MAG: hypothetical protein DRI90_14860 [Deltaproteobacteria bacterium]
MLAAASNGCSDDGENGPPVGGGGGSAPCVPSPEIPDNEIDEDCDGWLATSHGFSIRATHPRVLIDAEQLATALTRMTGPEARDPYQRWFELIRQAYADGEQLGLTDLALLYRATGEAAMLDEFLARIPEEGDPDLSELLGLDLLFDDVPTEVKQRIMTRVAANDDCWYYNSIHQSQSGEAAWGYHAAYGATRAMAYAGAFALTPVELGKDPEVHRFDALTYVDLAHRQLAEDGHFWRMENRIAGDPTDNDALPGDFGGMYDNIGYDSSEESFSINLVAELYFLTGQDRFTGFLHDEHRGRFYQNMQYPHLGSSYDEDQWCRRAGTESHIMARIWNTQTDWISQPRADAVALTASLFQDGRMQHFQHNGSQRELCGAPFNGMSWDLLFYDDALADIPPSDNPTAIYFNGPGLVLMREDWTNDAAFGAFIAGEGISRRYEDANSFLLHRKVNVAPHAGARIRNNPDNGKHHWYHVRSVAKNTLKIFDPAECLDLDDSSNRGPLHSGPPLVASDNLGGQLFETPLATQDGEYLTWNEGATPGRRSNPNHPLGLYEVANVIKVEHQPDDFTYTVGDGTAAYTRKIDFFERELVFLRPDVFVIFDRVQSVDPSFKKVWVMHTVDEPTAAGTPATTDLGMNAYDNAVQLTIDNPVNATYIDALLPVANRVVIRGGDSPLVSDQPLRSGVPINGSSILASDIPRWLELFAVGSDVEGTVTLSGTAEEGVGVTEEIVFDGTLQTYVSAVPTAEVTAGAVEDSSQHWQTDQWLNYQVRISCGGSSETALITGNDAHTLFGSFTPCSAWQYTVQRPLGNSYLHWIQIDSITTSDLDADAFTVSVPHYFDAEDASGRLASFAPHTDSRDDGYRRRPDLGQYTLNIEASQPELLTHFLNVISLKDPDQPRPAVSLLEASNAAGAVIAGRFVVFAKERSPLIDLSIPVASSGPLQGLVVDLAPNTAYYYAFTAGTLELSSTDMGGSQSVTSSSMGTASISLP